MPVGVVVPFISLLPSLKKCKQSFPARVSGCWVPMYTYVPLYLVLIRLHSSYASCKYIASSSQSIMLNQDIYLISLSLDSRDERQVGSGDPGLDLATTTRLDGTSRHYFALVHWTGHPSEVLFIVTMTRRENPTDSCLWR